MKFSLLLLFTFIILANFVSSSELVKNIDNENELISFKHGEMIQVSSEKCCVGEGCNPLTKSSCYYDGRCQIWGRQGKVQFLRCVIGREIVEETYPIYGDANFKDYWDISEDGVKYDPEIFRHFFLSKEIPITIEMRPTWIRTYDLSDEEISIIENNKKDLIDFLSSKDVNSTLIYSGNQISANVSKELLLTLLEDRRIGRIELPIRPNTLYEQWFNELPRDIKRSLSFILIFLNLGLLIFMTIGREKYDKEKNKSRRLFAIVNIPLLSFYFVVVSILSNNVCSGKGFGWVLLIFPFIAGSLIWNFIYSTKHKIILGKIISIVNIFTLVFIVFARSEIMCAL